MPGIIIRFQIRILRDTIKMHINPVETQNNRIVLMKDEKGRSVKMDFGDITVEDHLGTWDWLHVSFIVQYNGHLPSNTSDIEIGIKELRKISDTKGFIAKRTDFIGHLLDNKHYDYGFIDPECTTFSFALMEHEIEHTHDNQYPVIKYNLKNRQYRNDGFNKYIMDVVLFFPMGTEEDRTPKLYIQYIRNLQVGMRYYIKLNVGYFPGPIYQPYDPREESITCMRNMNMTNHMIHAIDGLVYLCKLELRERCKETNFKSLLLKMLHSQKYVIFVEALTLNVSPTKIVPTPKKSKAVRTLYNIEISEENCYSQCGSTLVTFVWKEDRQRIPAYNASIQEKLAYMKYYESLPQIRW
jgi:hypothetical protein